MTLSRVTHTLLFLFCGFAFAASGQDEERSIDDLKFAAEIGDAHAMFLLGERYRNGIGVEVDLDLAIEWHLKSAEGGNGKAMGVLGWSYLLGSGVKKTQRRLLIGLGMV